MGGNGEGERWGILKWVLILIRLGGFLIAYLEREYSITDSLHYATIVATLSLTKKGAPANYNWTDSDITNFKTNTIDTIDCK